MKESDAVILVLDELDAHLSGQGYSVPLGTAGDRDDLEIPSVIVEEWDTVRLRNRNGARNYAAPVVDEATGKETAREEHIFYEFTADIVARHTDEKSRDDILTDIRHTFLEYEDHPKDLHADVSEVTVGDARPRALPFREPDWFQGGIELSFVFVERLTIPGDALESVNESVAIDDPDSTWVGRVL